MIISITQATIDEAVALKRKGGADYGKECLLALAMRKATNLPITVGLFRFYIGPNANITTIIGPKIDLPLEALELRRKFDEIGYDTNDIVDIIRANSTFLSNR